MERYRRQILLPDFGLLGQANLQKACVAVVGAGGLGSPVLTALCRAGVGKLLVIDHDVVALENLHRQTLFFPNQVGLPKATCAKELLDRMNSDVEVVTIEKKLDDENASSLLGGAQVVVDGSDNFATRYAVNDACIALGIPWVYGGVYRNEAQVAFFNLPDENGVHATYRNLCPVMPAQGEVQACDEAGILGTLTGIAGNVMAHEVLKFYAGNKSLLANRLWIYQANSNQSATFTIVTKHTPLK